MIIYLRFNCSMCGRFWASSKVHIVFHMKMIRKAGQVKMYIFKQKCKVCNTDIYEYPDFLQENIEIAVNKLVIKILQIFYGRFIDDEPEMCFIKSGRQDGPHDYKNCEGCLHGVCERRRGNEDQAKDLASVDSRCCCCIIL
ncbi:hypothetical protein GDO86_009990 [Hymenochirus boettgeri]|uniref:3CxxC-type domain-containing protein n=1 Tax=Hymenochirus boettgeri TaxID=247094 RepID=A0A8T2JIH6_9PIPI|nr:hypothetical protein GDO86_009990 [Hymenochirus boettgeri]